MEAEKVYLWSTEIELLSDFLSWIYEHPELDLGEETYTGFTRSIRQPFLIVCEFLDIDGEKALEELRHEALD